MAKKNTDMKSLQIKTGGFANSINNTLKNAQATIRSSLISLLSFLYIMKKKVLNSYMIN